MDETKSISSSGLSQFALQPEQSKAKDELGQSEFLKLMLTQIKYQDPLNPSEGGEFLSQLAQFGTVNGITELQSSFDGFASGMQSSQALQASTMVGRSVLVEGNHGYLETGSAVQGAIELEASSGNVNLLVHDMNGQLVRQMELGTQPAGTHRFSWDGFSNVGQALPPGLYQVSAQANVDGEIVSQPTFIQGKVESVTLGGTGMESTLNLKGLTTVPISQVKEIL